MNSQSKNKVLERLKKRKVGMVFLAIQAILTIVISVLLVMLRMLGPLYNTAIIITLVVLFGLMVMGQCSRGQTHISFKVVIALFCILLSIGCFYLYKAYVTASTATDSKVTDLFQVVVLKDSTANSITDVKGEEFGIDTTQKNEAYNQIKEKIQKDLGTPITTKEYVDSISLVDSLYNKESKVIILNTAVLSNIVEDYPNFEAETRILNTYELVTKNENNAKVKSVTEEPFSIFISGIDTYGKISTKSRSDVNIIVTVNPKTKQIMLTSTPRDYFVQTSVSGSAYDKLTHAGIYGVECSMETLEKLYGIEINYYAKVNFSGFKDIINALGSVTVQSDYAFTAQHGEVFREGANVVDGKKALAFVRERHAFPSGDLQRNKNQQALIKAVIEKVASPAILSGFTGIMDAVKDSVMTNMSYEEIAALVQMQLNQGGSWNVTSFGVSGEGGSSTTYSNQKKAGYVMYIDEAKVAEASGYIKQVINGEVPVVNKK